MKSYWRVYIETLSICIIGVYLFSVVLFLSLLSERYPIITILDRCAEFCLVAFGCSAIVVGIAVLNMKRIDRKKARLKAKSVEKKSAN